MGKRIDNNLTPKEIFKEVQRQAWADDVPVQEYTMQLLRETVLERVTKDDDTFIVKGGSLLPAYTQRRSTEDIDLAFAKGTELDQNSLTEFLKHKIENPKLSYFEIPVEIRSIEPQRTTDAGTNVRVHVHSPEFFAGVSTHLDIGTSGPIIPSAREVKMETHFGNQIKYSGYPPEMLIAEKVAAMTKHQGRNSRLKDFPDIAGIFKDNDISQHDLAQAIKATLKYDGNFAASFDQIKPDTALKQKDWEKYRQANKLELSTPVEFEKLLSTVEKDLSPVLTRIVQEQNREKSHKQPTKDEAYLAPSLNSGLNGTDLNR